MTDNSGAAPAPPKKRSFFKKAAWQTTSKAEEDDKNMFSHSNEFRDIVAEQTRREEEKRRAEEEKKAEETRKMEEARQLQEARKRKAEERREGKRRRISTEDDDHLSPKIGSASSSSQAHRAQRSSRSKTPLSPSLSKSHPDALPSIFDTPKKHLSSGLTANNHSVVIDLGDSDDDAQYTIPARSSRRMSSEEPEEAQDPMMAALEAEALKRAANRSKSASAQKADANKSPAVAQLFLTSDIPNTAPLMVKVRIESTIEKPRIAWCQKQGFSPELTQSVFLTYKGQRVYDSTTIRRLGLRIDDDGSVFIDGDLNIYDESNLPKVHVQAWTEELFTQWKKEEAEAKRKAAESPTALEDREPTPEPAPQVKKIRLILKAKNENDFRISVHPHTTIEHLVEAYKQKMGLDRTQPITLMFDGDRLSPMDTISDADIDDMDSIEVHFK